MASGHSYSYQERMTVIPCGDHTLEGLYHRGEKRPPCLVVPPHPHLGGSMDAAVCAELTWALTQAGHATLRFNYRGVGASTGEAAGDISHLEDVRAAAELLRETAQAPRYGLVGYSFGAYLSAHLAAAESRVSHCVLIAPPTGRYQMDFAAIPARGAALVAILAEEDAYCDVPATAATVEACAGTVRVVSAADHFFTRGLAEVGRIAVAAVGSARAREETP